MRYTFTLLASTLLVLALGAALNFYFDPFGVWHPYEAVQRMQPQMRMKPGTDSDPRFAKPLAVINLKPQTIIVGSSRVRDGMDPAILAEVAPVKNPEATTEGSADTKRTGAAPAPIMNYGTAGMRATEGARFIRHAIDVAGVKTVIWGLDFFGFNDRQMDEMGKDRFGILQPAFRVEDYARLLLAWPTLSLTGDILNGTGTTLPNGFNLAPATPADAIDTSIMRNAVGFAKAPFLYGKFDSFAEHFKAVEDTLAYAAKNNVQVYLYTSPLHGMVIEAIFQAGADKAFHQWKRSMAELAEKYRMPAYDYMNYNSISRTKGAEAARYFFDGAHFTPLVSRMILSRYFELASERPQDFGVPLSRATVDREWSKLLADRREYIDRNKAAVHSLKKQLQ